MTIRKSEIGFKRIRIREEEYNRMTKRVDFHTKIHDIARMAMDALEEKEQRKRGHNQ